MGFVAGNQQIARQLRDTAESVIRTYIHASDDEDEVTEGMDRVWQRLGS